MTRIEYDACCAMMLREGWHAGVLKDGTTPAWVSDGGRVVRQDSAMGQRVARQMAEQGLEEAPTMADTERIDTYREKRAMSQDERKQAKATAREGLQQALSTGDITTGLLDHIHHLTVPDLMKLKTKLQLTANRRSAELKQAVRDYVEQHGMKSPEKPMTKVQQQKAATQTRAEAKQKATAAHEQAMTQGEITNDFLDNIHHLTVPQLQAVRKQFGFDTSGRKKADLMQAVRDHVASRGPQAIPEEEQKQRAATKRQTAAKQAAVTRKVNKENVLPAKSATDRPVPLADAGLDPPAAALANASKPSKGAAVKPSNKRVSLADVGMEAPASGNPIADTVAGNAPFTADFMKQHGDALNVEQMKTLSKQLGLPTTGKANDLRTNLRVHASGDKSASQKSDALRGKSTVARGEAMAEMNDLIQNKQLLTRQFLDKHTNSLSTAYLKTLARHYGVSKIPATRAGVVDALNQVAAGKNTPSKGVGVVAAAEQAATGNTPVPQKSDAMRGKSSIARGEAMAEMNDLIQNKQPLTKQFTNKHAGSLSTAQLKMLAKVYGIKKLPTNQADAAKAVKDAVAEKDLPHTGENVVAAAERVTAASKKAKQDANREAADKANILAKQIKSGEVSLSEDHLDTLKNLPVKLLSSLAEHVGSSRLTGTKDAIIKGLQAFLNPKPAKAKKTKKAVSVDPTPEEIAERAAKIREEREAKQKKKSKKKSKVEKLAEKIANTKKEA